MARRAYFGSVEGEVEAFAAAGKPFPKRPKTVRVRPGDHGIWRALMVTRAIAEWSEVDLIHAANLTRCLSDIERLSYEIEATGDVVMRGELEVVNPRHELVEKLTRRAITLTKLLHLHAVALQGDPRDQASRRAAEKEARKTGAEIGDDDGLLATPTSH